MNNILGQISKEPEVIKEITFWKKNKDSLGYESAEAFSKVLGTATAKHLSPIAEQMQPEEIKTVYQYVSDLMIKYCEDASENITGRAGLKFVPDVKVDVKTDINDMLDNLVTKMYHTDNWEDVKFLANENSARSITRKTTTSHMKYTARSQQRAGIKVLISRTGGAECCDYCAGLTGTFTSLSDLPDNFWSVHRNCTCSFHYNVGKTNDIINFSTNEDGELIKETVSGISTNVVKEEARNKSGDKIVFEWSNKLLEKNPEKARQAEELIAQLTKEYESFLIKVTNGSGGKEGGSVNVAGVMSLNILRPDCVIHEFGHSLAMSDRIKVKLADETEIAFMKELRKIRREYEDVVNGTPKTGMKGEPKFSISAYSHKNVDEFFAEAFAHAKMKEMGINIPFNYGDDFTYSQKVLDLVNKYFAK